MKGDQSDAENLGGNKIDLNLQNGTDEKPNQEKSSKSNTKFSPVPILTKEEFKNLTDEDRTCYRLSAIRRTTARRYKLKIKRIILILIIP